MTISDDLSAPTRITVRMTPETIGAFAGRLEKTADRLRRDRTETVKEGLRIVFDALKARPGGFLTGAWREDRDGRLTRTGEFSIGS